MVKSYAEFCAKAGEYPICDLMPSGVKAIESGEKRRAIGFGREGEEISRNPADILLEKLGMRRAIGFGREGELIKNGPSEHAHAVGFGRENEPAAVPPKHKTIAGYTAISKLKDQTR
ncbi:MAG: hypothetical protein ACI4PW_02465 [Alphaproteobacteria bacterium]|jgi:hypothetical protein